MAEVNRVTPYGEIVAIPLRGAWLGNRGCIHRGLDIVRPWATRRWITCALEFRGWRAPKWVPNRWTPLYFYDEALALAAGHRPCALCRRADYNRYREAVGIRLADDIDMQLHAERVDGRVKRVHRMDWRGLPAGTYVEIENVPHVVLDDSVRAWTPEGYSAPTGRPSAGDACVLTPPTAVQAIANGYRPQIAG